MLATLLLLAGGCRADDAGTPSDSVLAAVEQALTRDGSVFHGRLEYSGTFGGQEVRLGQVEVWFDPQLPGARQEWTKDERFEADIPEWELAIITDDAIYVDDGSSTHTVTSLDRRPQELFEACGGSVLSAVLMPTANPFGCLVSWIDAASPSEPTAEYGGRDAFVLEGAAAPAAGGELAMGTLYSDASTQLPIAAEIERPGAVLTIRYETEFSSAASITPGFFDRVAANYFEPIEKLDVIAADVPIYWLDNEFPLDDGALLVLAEVGGDQGPGFAGRLDYRAEGAASIRIGIWRPAEWEAFRLTELGQNWWTADCVRQESIALQDRSAVIYSGYRDYECRDGEPADGFMAVVEFPDAVISVNLPICFTCGPGGASPATLQEVIEGLRIGRPAAGN